jgi:threonine dehydrogenase-like Zn-dependent dehydrogenase
LSWWQLQLCRKEQVSIVLEIRPDRLEHYRKLIANIDASDERKDEMIHTLAGMMNSFIDAAYGVDSVQLARAPKLSQRFQNAARRAINVVAEKLRLVDLGSQSEPEGAIPQNPNPKGQHDPQIRHQKGSDILPRL